MPDWVEAGCDDYVTRLRGDYRLELVEIALGDRGSGDVRRAVEAEGKRMLAAAGERPYLVALQVGVQLLDDQQHGIARRRHRLQCPLNLLEGCAVAIRAGNVDHHAPLGNGDFGRQFRVPRLSL